MHACTGGRAHACSSASAAACCCRASSSQGSHAGTSLGSPSLLRPLVGAASAVLLLLLAAAVQPLKQGCCAGHLLCHLKRSATLKRPSRLLLRLCRGGQVCQEPWHVAAVAGRQVRSARNIRPNIDTSGIAMCVCNMEPAQELGERF